MEIKLIAQTNIDNTKRIDNVGDQIENITNKINQSEPIYSVNIGNKIIDYYEIDESFYIISSEFGRSNKLYGKLYFSKNKNKLYRFMEDNNKGYKDFFERFEMKNRLEKTLPQASAPIKKVVKI